MNYANIIRNYADDSQFASKFPTGTMLGLADALDRASDAYEAYVSDPTMHTTRMLDTMLAILFDSETAEPRPILSISQNS